MLSLEPTVTPLQEGNAVWREDLAALSHFKIKCIGSRISPAPRSLTATRCESAPALRPLKWQRNVPVWFRALPQASRTRPLGGSRNTEAGQKSNISSRYPQTKKREGEHFRSLKRSSAHMWCRWGWAIHSVVICPGEGAPVRRVTTHTNTKFVSFFLQATIFIGDMSQTPNHCRFTDSL